MHSLSLPRLCITLLATGTLAACGSRPIQPSDLHIQQPATQQATAQIPQPIIHTVALPAPKPSTQAETYSVIVTNMPAQEILFALARDAKINLDIHPGIQGTVTLNALNQTLPQILARIAKQIDMRYELDHGNLIVMPDTPYLHHYKIDYVNMARDTDGGISNTTQVGGAAVGSKDAGSGSNNSQISIKNVSRNRFWETLIQNIKDILHETDKILPDGSSETITEQSGGTDRILTEKKSTARKTGNETTPSQVTIQESDSKIVTRRSTFREAASVIANPENGIITVRATGKQHERIQEFIDQVMNNARRQVLIEVTVAEVALNNNYQQGIDWSRLRLGAKGFNLTQATAGNPLPPASNTGSMFILSYANPTSKFGNLSASISLLESFGDVRVLSSPKISVMNNQTAMLRVVNNLVYFNIEVTPEKRDTTGNITSPATYTTTPQTVPVGFTMSVTPQISDNDVVQINLRPTITRLVGYINDPNPDLNAATPNRIPQTQTREMESILKIENNQIAVMGGLMQDEINNLTDAIPGISRIPVAGELFKNRNDSSTKTELVIFLRPVVIKDASITGDFSAYRSMLPDKNFFKEPTSGQP